MPDVSAAGRSIAAAIERYGLTQKQAGAALGVSDRMVRQVLSGAKPGRNLEAAASQLAREGRVTAAPPRREQRVRAPGGKTTPIGPKVERTSTVETGGRSQTVIEFPPRGLGRDAAAAAVLDDLEAHRARRVTVQVFTRAGNRYTIGGKRGYVARVMRRRIADDGDDVLDWLTDEVNSLPNCTGSGGPVRVGNVVRVVLTYFT